jgi:hypothetical protein
MHFSNHRFALSDLSGEKSVGQGIGRGGGRGEEGGKDHVPNVVEKSYIEKCAMFFIANLFATVRHCSDGSFLVAPRGSRRLCLYQKEQQEHGNC